MDEFTQEQLQQFMAVPFIHHYFYRHSDHLGSANWITDYHGDPIQYLHYLPYGELLLNQQVAGYNERYKFTDKERDAESGYDYFGARYYASPLYNWTSVDPLSDKSPQISPYAYCNWNPIKLVDPDGRSFSDFDAEGNYLGTSHDNWWHNTFVGQKGRVLDSEGTVATIFNFADPGQDVANLKSGNLKKLQFVQESDIVGLLKDASVFDDSNRGLLSRYLYAWNEGQAFGKLDFSKNPNGIGSKYLDDTYKSLYLIGGVAYNPENFGNFLFGAAGVSLGIHPSFLLLGGHINSLIKSDKNGYPSQLDSFDDQLSIFLGTLHANLHLYPFKKK